MTIGVVGKKSGMSRVFEDDGSSVPVTVIHVEPNRVTQVKTSDEDSYDAVQVSYGPVAVKPVPKAIVGHYNKASIEPAAGLHEFRLDDRTKTDDDEGVDVGAELGVGQFFAGQYVDVSGTSKGKGFAGVIKRWNFSSQDATHGNSLSHRAPGSIGQCQTPGKVFKGKKMAGHLGNARVTVQNLRVVRVDNDRNLLLVKGAVPGANGTDVIVRASVKKGVQSPA